MEEKMRAMLEEDEKLLWTGRPERFETLDKTNRKSILIGLAVKVAVALFILLYYLYLAGQTGGIKPGVIFFVVIIAGYAILNPFLVARRLRDKTLYGLTDRRVLRTGANEESAPYERMKAVALRTDSDGHTTLLCGPRTQNLKPHQWRGEADAAFINGPDDPEAVRVILYNLPKDKELMTLLKRYLPID